MRVVAFLCCSLTLTANSGPLVAQTGPRIATASDCARQQRPEEELACLRAALEAREALDRGAIGEERRSQERTRRAAPDPVVADLGGEQLNRHRPSQDDEGMLVSAKITQAQVDHLGRLTVRLDNGQTWQQTEPSAVPLRIRAGVEQVEISRSGFGGYRLRLPEIARRIAVRRID